MSSFIQQAYHKVAQEMSSFIQQAYDKAGHEMSSVIQQAYDKAIMEMKAFAARHLVLVGVVITIVALVMRYLLWPMVLAALGFGERGITLGTPFHKSDAKDGRYLGISLTDQHLPPLVGSLITRISRWDRGLRPCRGRA